MTRQVNINSVDSAEIVIVGNGIAGLTAAVEARRLAPEKRIVVVTEQNHPTINTPALKQFAIGKLTREQLLAYPAGTERAQRIHVINTRVEEIHAQSNYVSLGGGRGFGYESLLIATGSAATGLPANLPGRDFEGVLTLHRLVDYLNMRRRLSEVEEAVVIGGGSHAIETVVSLLYWGIRVHWLIRSDTFLPRMLDRPASDMVLERIHRAGAKVYTETEVLGIIGRVGAVAGVVTNQHQLIPCELVLVCTGTTPVTSLARHCDLPMKHKRGILVDEQLRTSVRNIYAAGDVAALRDPQTGRHAPRAQWYAAVLQGRRVAAALAGSALHEEDFGVPWHATRLGELSMLTVGNPIQWLDTATTLTDSSKGSYRRVSIIDDQLVGYLSLGPSQPDGLAIKRLIDEGLPIRDITKALLKGDFDARKYFSRKRTYAAQYMVNTGKLPYPAAIDAPLQTGPLVRALRETGPLASPGFHILGEGDGSVRTPTWMGAQGDASVPTPRHAAPAPTRPGIMWRESTQGDAGVPTPRHAAPAPTRMGRGMLEEGDDALPPLQRDRGIEPMVADSTSMYRSAKSEVNAHLFHSTHVYRANTDVLRRSESIPGESEALFFEEGFAPHQEMEHSLDRSRVVESTLAALPSDAPRRASGSLWSYSDTIPAVKAKRRSSQFIAPVPTTMARQILAGGADEQYVASHAPGTKGPGQLGARVYPSSSLWSYSDKHAAIKKGR
jgi:NADPH-dependent 2,4-dienoyl-CoA reductase/sulfur reductase-like enzyme